MPATILVEELALSSICPLWTDTPKAHMSHAEHPSCVGHVLFTYTDKE